MLGESRSARCRSIPPILGIADKATREDVDHDHNPVTAQEDGFAAEQVNTPQAVLGLGEKRQPGWAISSRGPRHVMFGEDAAHHVLVQFDAERMANLLGNPQMAEIRVSGFHLDDCCDQFRRRALWPRPAMGSGGREQSPVLVIDQNPVEPEQRVRFEDHGQLRYAAYADEKGRDPSTTRSKDVKFGARLRERPTMTS
jgi:hypothetical protein